MNRRRLAALAVALTIVTGCVLVLGLRPRAVSGLALPLPPAPASVAPARPAPPGPPASSAPTVPTSRLARPGDCVALVNGLDARSQVAQLVVVGVSGDDPAATVSLVRENQV